MNDVRQMLRKVRAVVLRQGVAVQDVDDILQEAFARMESYTRSHELRSREAFMVTTAVNLSRDQARRRAKAPFDPGGIDLEATADGGPQPEERLRIQESLRRASSGPERLDPLTRRCLLAQRLDGLTSAKGADAGHGPDQRRASHHAGPFPWSPPASGRRRHGDPGCPTGAGVT